MKRRTFLMTSIALASSMGAPFVRAAAGSMRYKAAVIGWTGRGDYGHGFDLIFKDLPNVSLEAIADPDPEGLKKAADRSGAKRSYSDYRVMLEKERPDIVSIAPRHPSVHKELALAAIAAGAHIYMEKPMTESLEDADAIIQAAERQGTKVAIGHTRRFNPEFVRIKQLIDEGFVGRVLDVRIQGKQDSRAGGEDLIVLGTHDLDLMRFYFGDPFWCFASVTQNGRRIGKSDVRHGHEPIWVAGDTVRADYAFPNHIHVSWNSVKTPDHWNRRFANRDKWGFEIHGTQRIIAHQSGIGMVYLDSPFLAHRDDLAKWRDLPMPKNGSTPPEQRHPIVNLIHAIETGSQPLCSGYDGRWTIEMVSGVYESERTSGRVEFPLRDRTNPLTRFS